MRIYLQAQPWNTLGYTFSRMHLEIGRVHTLRFSFGIESDRINGIVISHAIMEHSFVDDYVVSRQLLEDGPFFIIFGFV